ncbi:MAG: hypothetical protein Q9173_006516 [Seirophora scorigena]
MATSNDVSRIAPTTSLDIPAVRRGLQAVWDEYKQLAALAAREHIDLQEHNLPAPRQLFDDPTHGQPVLNPGETGEVAHWSQTMTMHVFETEAALTNRSSYSGLPAQEDLSQDLPRPTLLTLPPELLEQILRHVLGEQVIHVDDAKSVVECHSVHCQDPDGCLLGHGPKFQLRPCVAPISEEQALRQFHTQASNIPADDHEDWYVEDAHCRHGNCRSWEDSAFPCTDPAIVSPRPQRFAMMQVCRQLAPRAFEIFWATNIFYFEKLKSFSRFLICLNNRQLQLIEYIYLNINQAWGRYDFDPFQLRRLSCLSHLHISVDSQQIIFDHVGPALPPIHQIHLRAAYDLAFLRLEVLNCKRVTAIVYDDANGFGEDPVGLTMNNPHWDRFTLQQKRDLADVIEKILSFEEESRQVLAAKDREIFEMEELLTAMKISFDIRSQIQSDKIWERRLRQR